MATAPGRYPYVFTPIFQFDLLPPQVQVIERARRIAEQIAKIMESPAFPEEATARANALMDESRNGLPEWGPGGPPGPP